jgi:hypothetical protein
LLFFSTPDPSILLGLGSTPREKPYAMGITCPCPIKADKRWEGSIDIQKLISIIVIIISRCFFFIYNKDIIPGTYPARRKPQNAYRAVPLCVLQNRGRNTTFLIHPSEVKGHG